MSNFVSKPRLCGGFTLILLLNQPKYALCIKKTTAQAAFLYKILNLGEHPSPEGLNFAWLGFAWLDFA